MPAASIPMPAYFSSASRRGRQECSHCSPMWWTTGPRVLATGSPSGRTWKPQSEWDAVCRGMEAAFKTGDYRRGALEAVEAAGRLLARHFPGAAKGDNELPDRPVLL